MFSAKIADGVELKLLQEHHASPLFELVDANRDHLREWLPWVDRTETVYDTLEFIKMTKNKFAQNIGFETGIWVDDEIVGIIGLHFIEWMHRRSSIGYWLGKGATGRGIMTKSVEAYLDYLFGELDLNYVQIHAATGNTKSRAIAERLGFQHEGTLRDQEWLYDHFVDMEHYGMRAVEWFDRKKVTV
tara:strand:- start:124 stop:684 length:561 start_codon:yes stop_codon:yes gene_type:complete